MFRIPDFALGALITAIIATFAIFSAFPDFGNLIFWMPLIGGVLIAAAAAFAGIGSNSERLNVALVLASAVTGLLIAMQLVEMRKVYKPIADQAQTLRTQIEEMKLEQRAWVSITSIVISRATKDINGLSLTFVYSVENYG
jgi:predicted membrane-bound spermidine synthase